MRRIELYAYALGQANDEVDGYALYNRYLPLDDRECDVE